ncbi:MAG TPA: peptidoglycan-binding domain-containing protein [Pseudonocardiaceae bacterium]
MADRRLLRVGVVVLAVAAVGGGTAVVVQHNESRPPAAAAAAVRTGTTTVVRTDLTTTIQLNGTIDYAGAYTVANQATGTYTALPAVGQVIGQGQTLYEVDGHPILLCYGSRPAWRTLAPGVPDGPDVAQLKQNLVALGYARLTINDHFDTATYQAIRRWQTHVGTPVTGALGPADIVFAAGPIRVASMQAALGDQARPGTLIQATGTAQIVNLTVPVVQEYLTRVGDPVSVILPDGTTAVPGTITAISATAAANPGQNGQSNSQNAPAVATATVELTNPTTTASYDQAPVTVNVTDQSARGVLAVPINALVALAEGGYGVWVLDHGTRRLFGVHTGLFADTLVQITGTGIAAGMTVEVPAS